MPMPPPILWPVPVVWTPLIEGHERTPDVGRGGWKGLSCSRDAWVNHFFRQGIHRKPSLKKLKQRR